MTKNPNSEEQDGVHWIDISSYSQTPFGRFSDFVRRFFFLILVISIPTIAVIYGAFLTTTFGLSDDASIIILIVAFAIVMGTFMIFMRSVDDWVSGSTVLGSELAFTKSELNRTIAELEKPLRDVLAAVARFTASKGTVTLPDYRRREKRLVIFYRFMIGVGMVAAYFIYDFVTSFEMGGLVYFIVSTITFAAGLAFAGAMYNKATTIGRPTVEQLRSYDHRDPVLLLRSFKDDELRVGRRFRTLPWSVDYYIRFEQAVAGRLSHVGPVIAVSAPGEELPQLGAARAKLEDGEWQEKVAAWMSESAITVMIAGTTEWIRWELNQAIEQSHLDRLLIVIPPLLLGPQASTLNERWENVLRPFAGTPWQAALSAVDPKETLLVQLEPEGGVTAFRSPNRMVRDYQLALTLGIYRRHCADPA